MSESCQELNLTLSQSHVPYYSSIYMLIEHKHVEYSLAIINKQDMFASKGVRLTSHDMLIRLVVGRKAVTHVTCPMVFVGVVQLIGVDALVLLKSQVIVLLWGILG